MLHEAFTARHALANQPERWTTFESGQHALMQKQDIPCLLVLYPACILLRHISAFLTLTAA